MSASNWKPKRLLRKGNHPQVPIEVVFEAYGSRVIHGFNTPVKCVLHHDKQASAVVSTEKGVWYCHTCGVGGDAIKLIMLKEGIDYRAAITRAENLSHADSATVGRESKHRMAGPTKRTWNL